MVLFTSGLNTWLSVHVSLAERTPSARIKSASRAQTGSPKEVLEVPFRHQLNGIDHPVCRSHHD